MLVILPFEKDYYQNKWNWAVDYVGHPLIEVIQQKNSNWDMVPKATGLLIPPKTIALLPGSRKQEIATKLPIMLSVAPHFPKYEFVVAMAPGQEESFYQPFLATAPNVSAVSGGTYQLLLESKAALVTSGTATLETALLGTPEIVCYKGSNISYQIAKRLISIKYISLVNLIMDKPVVKELIQHELTTENLVKELKLLLNDSQRRQALDQDYKSLFEILSSGGNASAQAAKIIDGMIRN